MMKLFSFLLFTMFFLNSCNNSKTIRIESSNFDFIQLEEGIYTCIHKIGGKAICNVGVVDNGKETIIFDTFLSPSVAEELKAALEQSDLSPIRYVINSHSHNDHVRGNQVFGNDVKIISTELSKELIEKWEPLLIEDEKSYAPELFHYWDSLYVSFEGDTSSKEYQNILMWRPYYEILSNSHAEVQTRLPDTFMDSTYTLDGPDRRVQLLTSGGGHTESDLVMYLPDDNILFSGDLVFSHCHPYIPHGSIPGWISWLDLLDTFEVQTVVPGHGQIGSKSLIPEMRDYLVTINSLAMELHSKGVKEDELNAVSIPEKYKDWGFDRFFYSNIRFAYATVKNQND